MESRRDLALELAARKLDHDPIDRTQVIYRFDIVH
jgi:hypothetical protein